MNEADLPQSEHVADRQIGDPGQDAGSAATTEGAAHLSSAQYSSPLAGDILHGADAIAEFLYDDALVKRYDFFIFEVVRAHVARSPKHPETLHYTGDGVFMVSGRIISRRAQFRPGML